MVESAALAKPKAWKEVVPGIKVHADLANELVAEIKAAGKVTNRTNMTDLLREMLKTYRAANADKFVPEATPCQPANPSA